MVDQDGIVGVNYFSQMSWPVGLFVFSQLPNHLHNGLMRPLQPACSFGDSTGMVYNFFMLRSLNISSMMLLIKLSSLITQESWQGPQRLRCNPDAGTWWPVLAVWLGVIYAIMGFVKWSWNTRTLVTLRQSIQLQGFLYASESLHARGPLEQWPQLGVEALWTSCPHVASCTHVQDLMDCCIWLAMPGHQKCSCNKDRYSCDLDDPHPYGTHSRRWHNRPQGPGRVEDFQSHLWALSTGTNSLDELWNSADSVRSAQSSSLEMCSARSAFKSIFFCAFSQSNTVLNIGSSYWASAQSVMCICTRMWAAVTCTSCSNWQLPLTTARLSTSARCMVPTVTPLRIDLTVSSSSQAVSWLKASTSVLSCPFWYSNWKVNHARAPTH